MGNTKYFLNEVQYNFLANLLPAPPYRPGRPAIPNSELLGGLLYILRTGCRWEVYQPRCVATITVPVGVAYASGRSMAISN